MKTKLLEIINFYGIDNQQRKLEEEVFELQQAIIKFDTEEKQKELKENIVEEMADVCVLLMQITDFYKLDVVKMRHIMEEKIDRQLERIKSERSDRVVK